MIYDLKRRFRYKADRHDGWRIMDEPRVPLEGDCDDFAITAVWMMAGCSRLRMWWWLLTFKAVIWIVMTDRDRLHAALWLRGHGWIDNIYPDWSNKVRHRKLFPVPVFWVAQKLIVGNLTR